jgi:putative tryptophan/tyrosine transport system substrate-binding protein
MSWRRWGSALLVGLALGGAAELVAAQTPARVYRVGFLTATSLPFRDEAFRQEMRRLGYTEGRNLTIEYRSAEGQFDRLPALAAELVALKVDVIAAAVTQASLAAKKATDTIPIVMMAVSDPVRSGLVASIARPGANVTGTASASAEVVGKQLDLLRELRPKASRLGVLWNPANPVYQKQAIDEVRAAARKLKIGLQVVEARSPDAFDRAFATIAGLHVDALLVLGDPVFGANLAQLAELGVKHRLLTLSGPREYAEHGLLMTYGPSFAEAYRLSAGYVDRLLKGARPADLPVEVVRRYELVVNARTARALGVTLPQSLVARADEVVQ